MARVSTPTKHRGIHSYSNAAGKRRYLVRARDINNKPVDREGFETLADAQGYQAQVRDARAKGVAIITPAKARATMLEDLWPDYLEQRRVSARRGTVTQNERQWRTLIKPKFGHLPLARLTTRAIQSWVAELEPQYSANYIINTVGTLRGVMDIAVTDGLMADNPCSGVKLPKRPARKLARRYLKPAEVQAVAEQLEGQNLRAFLTLVYVGLRWGELAGLDVRDVDFDRKRIRVHTSAAYLPNDEGEWEWHEGSTKTNQVRSAGYPPKLESMLRAQVGERGGDEILFPSEGGGRWRQPAKQSGKHRVEWLERALRAANVGYLSPNELRHTCASMLVSAGANVLAAARQMGHSPTMLLHTYADLFDEDLDEVARKMDALFPHFSPTSGSESGGNDGNSRELVA